MFGQYERLSPIDGKPASRTPAMTVAEAVEQANIAGAAFPSWAARSPADRRARLIRAADELERRGPEFATLLAHETGSAGGGHGVHLGAAMLRESAALTTRIGGETLASNVPGRLSLSVRDPVGVVLGIAPWNAAVPLAVRAVAMPIACGNTAILKASEMCPATHLLIGTILTQVLGEGVVVTVTNRPADAPAIVEALIAHTAVRRVNFTGSTRVGRIIAQHAARELKPALLELGGKAALIVLADADVDAAVDAAIFGAFANSGQICMSTERIIVDESVADVFVARLADRARRLTARDPRIEAGPLGAVIDDAAVERIESLIRDAIGRGARLAVDGLGAGTLMNPTVLDAVTPAMAIFREESFGPVVSVVRVPTDDEAVRLANDCAYGLSAAVFGSDINRALGIARRVEAGMVHINGPTIADEPQAPFGGLKASGYGRFGGTASIAEFTELRWITINDPKTRYSI